MPDIPVAEYVRMSTDDQKFSIPGQEAAIRKYAMEHGFFVCRTYADVGKSGLLIKHRPGLKMLLQDVLSGRADYKAVLVSDVSRWGRFQNPDESAHYEFICANAGIPVHYCAEQFSNDGSMQSALVKAIKRTMAGEFSRELGIKVYDAVKRLVLEGFHGGGLARYGLSRRLIAASGRAKGILRRGEAKNLKSDRVVLVRGNRTEVRNVRRIFAMCAYENKNMRQIADELNGNGSSCRGQPWDSEKIRRILRSPEYLGLNVWGQRSLKLHGANVQRPRALWVTSKAGFRPIIDEGTFEKAQQAIAARRSSYSSQEMLSSLRRLLARKGRLSISIINGSKGPHTTTYKTHFGSLLAAYERAGFRPSSGRSVTVQHTHAIRGLHKSVVGKLQSLFPADVELLRQVGGQKTVIQVDGRSRVSILLCGYRQRQRAGKKCKFWLLRISPAERHNIALICTLDANWKSIVGYYLVRPLKDSITKHPRLHDDDPLLASGHKLATLDEFRRAVRALSHTAPALSPTSRSTCPNVVCRQPQALVANPNLK